MTTNSVASRVHMGGRVVLWVVLILLLLAMVFATAMIVVNWGAISV